jgi:tartrate dehydrogenase/decarboxylase/D-malate dehydrogenase
VRKHGTAYNPDPSRRHPRCRASGTRPFFGKGIANPLAAFFSASMMLDHLGYNEAALAVERSISAVLAARQARTADLGGSSTTSQVSAAVVSELSSKP